MGHKGHDLIGAHLCAACHGKMDTTTRDKTLKWELSEEFLHYCALTLIRLWDAGVLKAEIPRRITVGKEGE
jgi:hypothetical protein